MTSFVRALPKVELHLHLEGSVTPQLAAAMAARNGVTTPRYPPRDRAYDFSAFLGCYIAISNCFAGPDEFAEVTETLARTLGAQGVVHAEVTVTPMTHVERGVPRDAILEGLVEGRRRAAALGVSIGWVFDVVRIFPAQAQPTLDAALALQQRDPGAVVGFGVGGPEREDSDNAALASAFTGARRAGLAVVPHAGEQAGARSMWSTLRNLGAHRIGHGVRCLEDATLVDFLRRAKITLEVCPTSNVALGVVASFDDHPLPRLLDAGLNVTLATDDPGIFGNDLVGEYVQAATTFGWGPRRVRQIVAAGIRASCLSRARRKELLHRLDAVPDP